MIKFKSMAKVFFILFIFYLIITIMGFFGISGFIMYSWKEYPQGFYYSIKHKDTKILFILTYIFFIFSIIIFSIEISRFKKHKDDIIEINLIEDSLKVISGKDTIVLYISAILLCDYTNKFFRNKIYFALKSGINVYVKIKQGVFPIFKNYEKIVSTVLKITSNS